MVNMLIMIPVKNVIKIAKPASIKQQVVIRAMKGMYYIQTQHAKQFKNIHLVNKMNFMMELSAIYAIRCANLA